MLRAADARATRRYKRAKRENQVYLSLKEPHKPRRYVICLRTLRTGPRCNATAKHIVGKYNEV